MSGLLQVTLLVVVVGLLLSAAVPVSRKKGKHVIKVPPEQQKSGGAYESDIIMTPEDLAEIQSMGRVRRKAVHKNYKLWPDGVVHYEFDKNVGESNRSMILRAIHHWEERTCLKFVPSNGQGDRISFIISDRCTSNIGKAGGKQSIDLSLECIKELGSIAHEIGHAAGFYHEHSRPDRDDHIKVIKENIQTGRTGEFNKYGESTVRDIEPYDVSSVMHYGLTYFSKDDESHTLDPIDPKLQEWLGQRVGLSFMDVKTANELYNCFNKCPKSLACKNEGYIGPKCACVCPDGITGDLCTEVIQTKKACGGVLTSPSGTITSPNYPGSYDVNTECNWMIQGSAGSVITLTFHDFEVENDDKGMCHWDFLEIRKYGPHLPGQRYCGESANVPQYPKGQIKYQGEALMIRLSTDDNYNFRGFRATYTIQ